MTLLAFRDVTCMRGGRQLFAGISLTLEAGGATLITGPNGVGKSSLIRIAAGLLDPAGGTVDRSETVALLAEASAFDSELPLARALRFWAELDGRGDAVAMALDAVGLAPLAPVPVRLLSTGQRRRAALARVVASGARLWLLDEPANGLDAASLVQLERLVARHRAEGGAVLAASHSPIALPDAQRIALGAA
jgi:heme exporter protein A